LPKNWSVGEPESVYDYLEENNDKIEVGDTIEYISNNQMGYEKYKVVLDDDGKKMLTKIADYDSMMEEMENREPEEDEEEQKGGKRRRRKTMRKTRRHKKSKHHKKTRRHRSKKHRRH
jgi:hypothetical protein